jgi:hypothetical protein
MVAGKIDNAVGAFNARSHRLHAWRPVQFNVFPRRMNPRRRLVRSISLWPAAGQFQGGAMPDAPLIAV